MSARVSSFVLVALTVSLSVGGVVAGCSSDGVGTAESLPPIASTTTITTVPPTIAPTSPPTAAATTLAPTTVSVTLAPASTTSSTIVGETTTSTSIAPRGSSLILRDDGIGDAVFGADPDEVIAYISSILGRATGDSGWADPFSSFGVCPGTEVRGVTWGDLTLLFTDSSVITSGRRHFFTYDYGPPRFGSSIDPAGPRTATGISVGSTVGELRAAYPTVIVNPADDIFEANFYINDDLTGFLTGADDSDLVLSFTGGISCGE